MVEGHDYQTFDAILTAARRHELTLQRLASRAEGQKRTHAQTIGGTAPRTIAPAPGVRIRDVALRRPVAPAVAAPVRQ